MHNELELFEADKVAFEGSFGNCLWLAGHVVLGNYLSLQMGENMCRTLSKG